MSQPPSKSASTGKKIETAIEKALDPLASALKRATQSAAQAVAAAPGKPGLMISPLAVPFPAIPPIGGVEIATARAGFYKHERDDLVVFRFPEGASCAGVFTRHKVGSAPVDWCKRHLDADKGGEGVKALVVNAGCANAFTGKAGADAARRTASEVAKRFGCRQRDVMLASTGVIGVVLDDKKIVAKLPEIETGLEADAWARAGRGIMTTDTFPKGAAASFQADGGTINIVGIAKGSGMIAPDMATMLVYVFTDARIAPELLQRILNGQLAGTFNAITVDSDTSTSDALILAATGRSKAAEITDLRSMPARRFGRALGQVMLDLAQQVVRDGEGATKFVEIQVTGAASHADAHRVAMSIANSPLVKTAIAGEDANWGRVVMAVGKSGAQADRDRLTIRFGDMVLAENGWRAPDYDEAKASAYMKRDHLVIGVDLGLGKGRRTVWTCDLTHGYIDINADYRS